MELRAEIRTQKGKSGVKRVREKNKIPAILYGHNETPVLLQLSEKDVKHLTEGEHLSLDFGTIIGTGKSLPLTQIPTKVDTIIKEVQWDPIAQGVLHIDFQRLKKGEKIKVKIPLIIEGADAIVKKGGILEHKLSELEIECLPREIPEELKIDISDLNIGDSLYLRDLPKIKGEFIDKIDTKILTILAPKKIVEEKPPEEVEVSEEKEEGAPEEKAEKDKAVDSR